MCLQCNSPGTPIWEVTRNTLVVKLTWLWLNSLRLCAFGRATNNQHRPVQNYTKLVTHAAASSCHVLPGGFHGDTRARSNCNVWCLAQWFHEFDDQLGQYCQYLLRNCVPSLPNSLRPCQTFSRHISVCLHFSLRDGLNQTCSRYVMTRVFGEEASSQWHN